MSMPTLGSSIRISVAVPELTGFQAPEPEMRVTFRNRRSPAEAVRSSEVRTSKASKA